MIHSSHRRQHVERKSLFLNDWMRVPIIAAAGHICSLTLTREHLKIDQIGQSAMALALIHNAGHYAPQISQWRQAAAEVGSGQARFEESESAHKQVCFWNPSPRNLTAGSP